MKKVRIEDAIGMVLAHDITRIVPGKFKGVGFKKGHVIRKNDIPKLLELGKRHLYALSLADSKIHEDDAAKRIAKAVSGKELKWTDPSEGKTNIVSKKDGVLKIDTAGLLKINRIGSIIIATLRNNFPVSAGQIVAATRIIPLIIPRKKIERLEAIAEIYRPVIRVLPYRRMKVGAVVTGNELYNGLIKDGFDQYVGRKVQRYGSKMVKKIITPDDPGKIADSIEELEKFGCDLILTTGGLSVDPDDVTRVGIKRTGAKVLFYGTPILPGAMFLYAFLNETPILGLPACVYYHDTTIFDLMLPRALAGDIVTKADIAEMGHGGLCMNCQKCQYPVCPFGK